MVKPRSDTSIDTTSLLLEELERKANEDDGDEDDIVNADASSGEAAAKMAMDFAFIVII